MTTVQLKAEIHKAIDNVPENALSEVLHYLESVQESTSQYDKINRIIDKIFEQEDKLLRRLAE